MIGIALALAAASPATGGFAIDWQGTPPSSELDQSMAAQVALVRQLPISADAASFFAQEPIFVDVAQDTKTRAGRAVFMARRVQPPADPVLLHELIHRWQLTRMAGGRANPDVLRFYAEAKSSGHYPAGAYMLSNPVEFFAMTASVVLAGRAARPPFDRATVRRNSPRLYAFIVRQFGLRGA